MHLRKQLVREHDDGMFAVGKSNFWCEELLAHPHICVRHCYKESYASQKTQKVCPKEVFYREQTE